MEHESDIFKHISVEEGEFGDDVGDDSEAGEVDSDADIDEECPVSADDENIREWIEVWKTQKLDADNIDDMITQLSNHMAPIFLECEKVELNAASIMQGLDQDEPSTKFMTFPEFVKYLKSVVED